MKPAEIEAKPNIVRRLYDWVLSWADSKYAAQALLLLAFAESSFFPIPPDVLLVALALSVPGRAFRYALLCTVGSLLGGFFGYYIGKFGYASVGQPIIDFYHAQDLMLAIKARYDAYGFWGVLVAAITPIPYKVFTISSGFFSFNLLEFAAASVIGRSFRFFLVAGLIWKFGEPIRGFIDKYFNLVVTIFVILLIGGFFIVKFVLK